MNSFYNRKGSDRGFTLIELLIVIAIVAILATITLLVLNPSEMLRKARDSKRISDLKTINDAIGLSVAQIPPLFIGTSTYVYVSLPDSDSACASYNLPSLGGTGMTYSCRPEATYRKTDGTGWIPANFDSLPSKVLSVLPVDPVNSNNASSGLYYTYVAGSWELDAKMESAKYGSGGSNDVGANDGGDGVSLFEVGSKLTLVPAVINDRTGASSTPPDTTPPTVGVTFPTGGTVTGTISIAASASDNVAVAGVQFKIDGSNLGIEDASSPYNAGWDTTGYLNGSSHTITAVARDTSNNTTTSSGVGVTVSNISGSIAINSTSSFAASSASTVTTFSHTVAGSNTLLIVYAGSYIAGQDGTVSSSATYNGVPMTKIAHVYDNTGASASDSGDLFYLVGPAAGIHNVVFSSAAATRGGRVAISLTGVNQVSALDSWSAVSSTLAQGGSATSSVNSLVTLTNNTWVWDNLTMYLPGAISVQNTKVYQNIATGIQGVQGGYQVKATAGVANSTWAWPGGGSGWVSIMAAFKPA